MLVRIRGKKWTVQDARLYGLCTHATRTIDVQVGRGAKNRMDTLIHEVLHALRPRWGEKKVCEIAKTLTVVLWKDGYRRGRR